MKRSIVTITVIFAILIFSVNLVANYLDWYHSVRYFDKWMHTFGGLFVVLALMSYFMRNREVVLSRKLLLQLIFLAICVGVLWEGYEYFVQGLTGVQIATIPDSLADIVFDTLGALLGVGTIIFVQQRKKRYNISNAN